MTYQYAVTDAERAAAELLRAKGWAVVEPLCPLCRGWGWATRDYEMWLSDTSGGTVVNDPCPNGCPVPSAFYSAITA